MNNNDNNNTSTSDTITNNITLNHFNTTFEPKSNQRFIANIILPNNQSLIPSYTIKSISLPGLSKENNDWSYKPLYITLYDPITLDIPNQLLINKSEPLSITITLLGPVADIIETWSISNAFITDIDFDHLSLNIDGYNDPNSIIEIKLQIKYDNCKISKP